MSELFDSLSDDAREKLQAESQPGWTAPMLATLTDDHFSDPDWIYERKFDGIRCLVFRDGEGVRLMSRGEKNMNDTWPELVDDLERTACKDFVADGEIVTFDGDVTSFQRLQQRSGIHDADEARASDIPVYLYLFDLIHVDGQDVTQLELRDRKAVLRRAIDFGALDRTRLTEHRNEEGEKYYREACDKGWEGVIAKDAHSTYVHSRSKKWLKFKCVHQQELVIGGYTEPQGSRIGFGALLVGYYDGDDLRYAGKVGTGYDDETLEELGERLEKIERETSPFNDEVDEKGVHFVTPELVGEFGFTEWTHAGKLRHPRFLGLRHDKDPEDVVRETPESAP